MTDAKINLEAAADKVGAVLPAEVTRALQADMEGRVVDVAQDDGITQPTAQSQQAQAATESVAKEAGPFGPIFDGFENNPEGAIAKLMQEKRGEVPNAFNHPELGQIGFVYGDNNMGLLHIANKRGIDWVNRIPEILRTGELVKDEGGLPRTYLVLRADTPPSVAVIRLDWDGEGKTWLVTAYPDDFGKFAKSENPDNNQKHTGRAVDGVSGFSDQSGQFDSATSEWQRQARRESQKTHQPARRHFRSAEEGVVSENGI